MKGDNWVRSSTDICIAGLGWISMGMDGVAELRVWRHEGIAVTTREALLTSYAADFESPGWSNNTKAIFKSWSGTQKGKGAPGGRGGRAQQGNGRGGGSAGGRGGARGGGGRGGEARGGRGGGRGAGARGSGEGPLRIGKPKAGAAWGQE